MTRGALKSITATHYLRQLAPVSAAVLSVLLCSGSVMAVDGEFYAGFGIGSSDLDPDITDSEVEFGSGSFGGYKVFLGYDLTNNISVEGFFTDLGHVDLNYTPSETSTNGSTTTGTDSTIGGLGSVTDDLNFPFGEDDVTGGSTTTNENTVSGELDYRVFGAQAIYQFPNNLPGFSGFGKLGLAQIQTTSNGVSWEKDDSSGVMGGLGAEYQMKNGVSVRGEYEFYDAEAQFISLSLLKRFGRPVALPPAPRIVDSDEDGVRDVIDQCPGTPTGSAVNAAGCVKRKVAAPNLSAPNPALFDRDMDGIPDAKDLCLDTMPGIKVDRRGCDLVMTPPPAPIVMPEPVVVQQPIVISTPAVIDQFTGVLEGVNFLVGSSQLTGEAKTILNQVAQDLMGYPQIQVTVVGHTDDSGSASANKRLSEARALRVAEYLAGQGVSDTRMQYAGKGEEEPVSSNATEGGRAKNRRVEMIAREVY